MATQTDIRQEVEDLTAQYNEAVNSKDMERLASFYEDTGSFMVAGLGPAEGMDEIRERQQAWIDTGVQGLKLECIDLYHVGDVAVEIGKIEITMQPDGVPEPFSRAHKSITVWRRQDDGSLKIWADCQNADQM